LHHNRDADLADVTVKDATTGKRTVLHTTWHHPFWNASARRWSDAKDLKACDKLRSPDGETTQTVAAVKVWTGLKWMQDLTVNDTHTYYVLAGNTPVLVHNCGDHIALGRTETVQGLADTVGARHVMGEAPGQWQNSVVRGAYDPATKFSVSLDGVEDIGGSLLRGRYKEAGVPATVGGRSPSWFDWEMHTLDQAGAWDRVTFYKGGDVVPNPFG
jgi:Pretoxin HINT domain